MLSAGGATVVCCLIIVPPERGHHLPFLVQGAQLPSTSGAAEPVEVGEQTEDVQLTDGQGQPMTYTAEQIKALNRDQVRRASTLTVSLPCILAQSTVVPPSLHSFQLRLLT